MDMYGLLGKPRGWYEFCVELNLSTTFLFSESICKNHLLNWKVNMLLKYWSKQETIEVIMKIQIEKKMTEEKIRPYVKSFLSFALDYDYLS